MLDGLLRRVGTVQAGARHNGGCRSDDAGHGSASAQRLRAQRGATGGAQSGHQVQRLLGQKRRHEPGVVGDVVNGRECGAPFAPALATFFRRPVHPVLLTLQRRAFLALKIGLHPGGLFRQPVVEVARDQPVPGGCQPAQVADALAQRLEQVSANVQRFRQALAHTVQREVGR